MSRALLIAFAAELANDQAALITDPTMEPIPETMPCPSETPEDTPLDIIDPDVLAIALLALDPRLWALDRTLPVCDLVPLIIPLPTATPAAITP